MDKTENGSGGVLIVGIEIKSLCECFLLNHNITLRKEDYMNNWMKKISTGFLMLLLAGLLSVFVVGCSDSPEDNMEEAGDNIEEAAEDVGDATTGMAEEAGDEIEEATD